jgi:uncharacterized membrane protein
MKRWMIGGILFASLALNIALGTVIGGAVIGGKALRHRGPPMKMVVESIAELPEPERAKAMGAVEANRPALHDLMRDVRQTRRDVFDYVVSDAYTRAEAESKLAELREKSLAAQVAAQTMMLEIADQLSQEHRELVFERTERSFH